MLAGRSHLPAVSIQTKSETMSKNMSRTITTPCCNKRIYLKVSFRDLVQQFDCPNCQRRFELEFGKVTNLSGQEYAGRLIRKTLL